MLHIQQYSVTLTMATTLTSENELIAKTLGLLSKQWFNSNVIFMGDTNDDIYL